MNKLLLLIYMIVFISISNAQLKFTELSGPYLGQTPPGITPEIFAPGIISTEGSEGCSAFSNDGKLFIWNARHGNKSTILETKLINGKWTKPEVSLLNSKYYDGDFMFSPNSDRLFFSSRRPKSSGSKAYNKSNIWFADLENGSWKKPNILNDFINTDQHESYPSLTSNNRLYFFANERQGLGNSDIFYSDYVEGKYTAPVNLGPEINTDEEEWDPYISPDEKYLIFCSTKEESFGEDDLYICFKLRDNSWSKAINMGSTINSSASENRPSFSPDEKYFFFVSTKTGNRDIYWVSSEIIEKFRPKE